MLSIFVPGRYKIFWSIKLDNDSEHLCFRHLVFLDLSNFGDCYKDEVWNSLSDDDLPNLRFLKLDGNEVFFIGERHEIYWDYYLKFVWWRAFGFAEELYMPSAWKLLTMAKNSADVGKELFPEKNLKVQTSFKTKFAPFRVLCSWSWPINKWCGIF